MYDEESRKARESALTLLGVRARSRRELQTRLRQKGIKSEAIEETLVSLESCGLVNDVEFSRTWVSDRSHARGLGRNRLAAELRIKGIDRETIAEVVGALDPEAELQRALRVGRQRLDRNSGDTPLETPAERRKLAALLQRRGFTWETCSRALAILTNDHE